MVIIAVVVLLISMGKKQTITVLDQHPENIPQGLGFEVK